MKSRSIYIITIENESRLEKIFQVRMSPLKLFSAMLILIITFMFAGALILYLSPAHDLLPGYLKDSERSATEEQHMRLDSLQQAYLNNEAFINNLMSIIGTTSSLQNDKAIKSDTISVTSQLHDSILPTSQEELRFIAMMRERDKYNVSVIAPLAAESMMFTPINEESIITEESKKSTKAIVILPQRSQVSAIADGTVISVSQSLREGGGTAVVIQHHKGFLSRCSRLGTVLIEPGDKVTGGQVIAIPSNGNSRKNEIINIEMWHNGTPLLPYEYLGDSNSSTPRYPITESATAFGDSNH